MVDLLSFFKHANSDDFFEALGRNDINERQLAGYLKIPDSLQHTSSFRRKTTSSATPLTLSVAGINNIATSFAHCCSPSIDDAIIGFISYHHGITIHRTDCKNITQLDSDKQSQLISVNWDTHHSDPSSGT